MRGIRTLGWFVQTHNRCGYVVGRRNGARRAVLAHARGRATAMPAQPGIVDSKYGCDVRILSLLFYVYNRRNDVYSP